MATKLTPANEEETAALVRDHAASGEGIEMLGGGTRSGLGHALHTKSKISTENMSGISLYEPGALTVVAQAGTPLADINTALAKEGQHLSFEPADYSALFGNSGHTTIGGIVATGVSGPRRIQAGSCRDSLIGVRFINGQGEAVKNGGRVMKNVTGYDLVKILCGSHGTLGLVSEVSFKLLPMPELTNTVRLYTNDAQTATTAMSMALTSPYDVTGAAYIASPKDASPHVAIRIEGFETSVSYRAVALKELLAETGDVELVEDDRAAKLNWTAIRNVSQFAGCPGTIWKVNITPSKAPDMANVLHQIEGSEALYDWGGGLIWILVPDHYPNDKSLMREAAAQMGGHATLFRASDDMKQTTPVFHPQPEGIARLTKLIKANFDPSKILNPGRMGI